MGEVPTPEELKAAHDWAHSGKATGSSTKVGHRHKINAMLHCPAEAQIKKEHAMVRKVVSTCLSQDALNKKQVAQPREHVGGKLVNTRLLLGECELEGTDAQALRKGGQDILDCYCAARRPPPAYGSLASRSDSS